MSQRSADLEMLAHLKTIYLYTRVTSSTLGVTGVTEVTEVTGVMEVTYVTPTPLKNRYIHILE